MAAYFLDTSAVVKRYVQEAGTGWVRALSDPSAAPSLFVSQITRVETVSAITKRERGGQLSPHHARTALADFLSDLSIQYRIIAVSETLVHHATNLARSHALRGYDALQLATAAEVGSMVPSLIFLSADVALNAAATREGLIVDDPNSHP